MDSKTQWLLTIPKCETSQCRTSLRVKHIYIFNDIKKMVPPQRAHRSHRCTIKPTNHTAPPPSPGSQL